MLETIFSKVWSVPEALCDTTPGRFDRIRCHKRHQNGALYRHPAGHAQAGQIKVKRYWLDRHSGDIYNGLPASHTGRVCFEMVFFNAFEMFGAMIYHAGLSFYHVGEGIKNRRNIVDVTNSVTHDLKKICCAAYYALGLELAYAVAASNYFLGNETLMFAMETVISNLQTQWSEGAPRDTDLRYYYHGHKPFSEIEVFYLPFCMVKIGNLNEKIPSGQYKNVQI